jgi:ribosomal protein L44E
MGFEDKVINELVKNISDERHSLTSGMRDYRKVHECLGCYKHEGLRVRGEEFSIKHFKDRVVIRLKCPECDKEWDIVINKKPGWTKRFHEYSERFKKLEESRRIFKRALND